MSRGGGSAARSVLVVVHRHQLDHLAAVADELGVHGVAVRVQGGEVAGPVPRGVTVTTATKHGQLPRDVELVLALGGDGTVLRAVEVARPAGLGVLGVNLGHVGFLTSVGGDSLGEALRAVAERSWCTDRRMTVGVAVVVDGVVTHRSWALNEVSLEKAPRSGLADVAISVDGAPVVTWRCDGVLVSTATGSTGYAFSARGPVVWPDVQAILVVPNNAHALFARALVVGPDTTVTLQVLRGDGVVICCDGRRAFGVPRGARVEVTRGSVPADLLRVGPAGVTDRLVEKFGLRSP